MSFVPVPHDPLGDSIAFSAIPPKKLFALSASESPWLDAIVSAQELWEDIGALADCEWTITRGVPPLLLRSLMWNANRHVKLIGCVDSLHELSPCLAELAGFANLDLRGIRVRTMQLVPAERDQGGVDGNVFFNELVGLHTLHLGDVAWSAVALSGLHLLRETLTVVHLQRTQHNINAVVDTLCTLPNLKEVNLGSSRLDGVGLNKICENLPTLEKLYIDDIACVYNGAFLELAKLKRLQHLDLSFNSVLSADIVVQIAMSRGSTLRTLRLQSVENVTLDAVGQILAAAPKLELLDVALTSVHESSLKDLGGAVGDCRIATKLPYGIDATSISEVMKDGVESSGCQIVRALLEHRGDLDEAATALLMSDVCAETI